MSETAAPKENNQEEDLAMEKEKERAFQEELMRARQRQAERYMKQRQAGEYSPTMTNSLDTQNTTLQPKADQVLTTGNIDPRQQQPQDQPQPQQEQQHQHIAEEKDKGKDLLPVNGDEQLPVEGFDDEPGNWWEQYNPSNKSPVPSPMMVSEDVEASRGERSEAKDKEKEDDDILVTNESTTTTATSTNNDFTLRRSRQRPLIQLDSEEEDEPVGRIDDEGKEDDEHSEEEEDDDEESEEEEEDEDIDHDDDVVEVERRDPTEPPEPTSMWSAIGKFIWGGDSAEGPAPPPTPPPSSSPAPKKKGHPRLRKLKKKIKKDKNGKKSKKGKKKKNRDHDNSTTTPAVPTTPPTTTTATTTTTSTATPPTPAKPESEEDGSMTGKFFAGLRAMKDQFVDNILLPIEHPHQHHHHHSKRHDQTTSGGSSSSGSSGYPGAAYRTRADDEQRHPTKTQPAEDAEDSWVYMRSPEHATRTSSSSSSSSSRSHNRGNNNRHDDNYGNVGRRPRAGSTDGGGASPPSETIRLGPVSDEELARRLQRELEEEEERQRRKDEEYARQLQRQLENEAQQQQQASASPPEHPHHHHQQPSRPSTTTSSSSSAPGQNPFGWFTGTSESDSGPGFHRTISNDNGRVSFSFAYGNRPPPPVMRAPEPGLVGLLNLLTEVHEMNRRQRHLDSLRNSVVYGDMSEAELAALHERAQRQGGRLRNSADMNYENLVSLAERIGPVRRGTNTNLLQALPTRTYERTDKHDPEEDKCSICLAEYETGDELRTLPCMHAYHKDCIDHWLKGNKTCPVCKYSLS